MLLTLVILVVLMLTLLSLQYMCIQEFMKFEV